MKAAYRTTELILGAMRMADNVAIVGRKEK
jgi:hypothetical protein